MNDRPEQTDDLAAVDPSVEAESSFKEGDHDRRLLKKQEKAPSIASEIVISMSLLMVSAVILITIFVSWVNLFPAEFVTRYSNYFLLPYILLFAATVAVFGWRLISRVVIRPLRELIEATDRVGRGDFDHKIEAGDSKEMVQLSRSFNLMTSKLARNRRQLEQHLEELKRVNQDLAQTRRELLSSEKLASVGRLAAGVAHEIGNPLASISGYLDLIGRRDYLKDNDREMLARVESEVTRIKNIIQELLVYSRPQDDSSAVCNLNNCVDSTVTLMRAQKGAEDVELRFKPGEPPPINANRSSLQQLVMNLVMNAIQAMPGGGKLVIETRAEERERIPGAVLSVADTGPGIPEEILDQIFDPFFTTKEPGQGTGLGLSICLRIVENLKGRIQVDSRPGRGTTFTVWLPAARPGDGGDRP